MPLYPLLLAPFIWAGIEQATIGVAVSAIFHLATLLLLWAGFLKSRLSISNLAVLVAAALFPGQIYYHAVFPLSLFTFLALGVVYLLVRDRWVSGALGTGLAAATYSPGLLLAPVVAVWMLIVYARRLPARQVAVRVGATLAAGATGFAAVLVLQQRQVGLWDAFFKAQEKYENETHNPLYSFLLVVRRIGSDNETLMIIAFQTILVAALAITLIVLAERSVRAGDRLDLLIVLYVIAFWLLPLSVGTENLALYRHHAMLLPAVLLLRRMRLAAVVSFLVMFALLAQVMAQAFFKGEIH